MEQAPVKQTSKLRETFTTFARNIVDKFPKRRASTELSKKPENKPVKALSRVGGVGLLLAACGVIIASRTDNPKSPQPTSVATYYLTTEATKLATPIPTPTAVPIPTTVKPEATPSPIAAPIVATRAVTESRGGPGASNPEGVKVLNEALPYIRIVNAAYTSKLESGEVVHGVDNDYGESITIKGGSEKQIPFTIDTKMRQKYIAITNGGINKDSLFVKITTLGGNAEIDLKDKKTLTFDQFLEEVKAQSELDKTLKDLKDQIGKGIETQLGLKPAYSDTYKYGDKGMWGFSDQEEPTTHPAKNYEEMYSGANTELKSILNKIKEGILGQDYYFIVSFSRETSPSFFNLIKANNEFSANYFNGAIKRIVPEATNINTFVQATMAANGIMGQESSTEKYGFDSYTAISTFNLKRANGDTRKGVFIWKTSETKGHWTYGYGTPNKTVIVQNMFTVSLFTGNRARSIIGGKDFSIMPGTKLISPAGNGTLVIESAVIEDFVKLTNEKALK